MASPLYTLDFSPVSTGLEYYRTAADKQARQANYQNALAQVNGLVDPRMMPVLGSMDPEHGPNALFGVYNATQQRDMMMAHHRAQEQQARANMAHQNAVLEETRRYHSGSLDLARQRMNMLDSRQRERYGLGGEGAPGGVDPSSLDEQIGTDPQGGFYLRKPQARATPISAPGPASVPPRPSIGMSGQGGAPLPVDRVDGQSSFVPTSGENAMPGVAVTQGGGRPEWMHPGGAALARERAQKLLEDTDMTRLDPNNPQHSVVIQQLGAAYGGGKLPTGKRWTLDDKHRLIQEDIPGGTKLTAGERTSAAMAKMGLEAIDYAQPILVGATDGKGNIDPKGDAATSGWLSRFALGPTSFRGQEIAGGIGETGRAFKAMESAVLDLNFYLSGKSVSDKERQTFMKIYMPQTTDSADTLAWKHDRLRRYFKIVQSVRDGVPNDDARLQEETRKAIEEGTQRERGTTPARQQNAPSGPKPGRYQFDPATGQMRPL